MFFKWKRKLEKRVAELENVVSMLNAQIESLQKRTISQKTTAEETPLSTNQLLDEWLNGKEDDNGN